MPIYQYDCSGCQRRVDVFFRSISRVTDPVCPECGGKQLKRVMSKVLRARSDSDRLNAIDMNQELGRLNSNSVGDFSRWAKDMGRRYDSELGSDFSQLAAKADNGDDPVERVDAGHTLRYRVEQAKHKARRGSSAADEAPADPYDPYTP